MSQSLKKILTNDPRFKETTIFLSPHFDERMRNFRIGNETFPAVGIRGERNEYVFEAQVPGSSMVLTNTMDGFAYRHGDTFDVSQLDAKLTLQIGIDEGFIAPTRSQFNPAKHRFYVHDEETDAIEVISKADLVAEALVFIGKGGTKEHRDLAAYLGENVLLMSENQINAHIKGVALSDPETIIKASHSNMFKLVVFLKKLVAHNLVRERNGLYFYGKDADQPMGDEGAVFTFMKDPKNDAVVRGWVEHLRNKGEASESIAEKEKKQENK